jgi:hypothetical protein
VIINELKRCEERPIVVKRDGKQVAKSNIYLLCCVGDGVEMAQLMGHQGVAATYGCRYGTCEGEHPDDKPHKQNHGMYFVKRNGTTRTIQSIMLKDNTAHFVSII